MFGLGFLELVIILVIILLLFGSKSLPELGRGLGSAVKNLKNALAPSAEETGDKGKDDAPRT